MNPCFGIRVQGSELGFNVLMYGAGWLDRVSYAGVGFIGVHGV